MNKFLILLPVLMSLSAFTCQERPDPIKEYVYCVTPAQYEVLVKAEPAKVGETLTGDARKDVKIEGAQNVLLRQWGEGLLTVIGSCTQ